MSNSKLKFLETKEFKLFLTVWLVYSFYLQMFGSSSMANTQSALTAAIVNEGRFEIDKYHKAGGNGNAYYNGHYYSGQAPGISFISIPIYFIGKQFFTIIPKSAVDFLFERLEKYGQGLPADWEGNKKVLSSYFSDLSKRQIMEYVLISGFILPIFTTSLIVSLSVVLLYSMLKEFTTDKRLQLSIALLYAFGTLLFPLSTEYFERPIALSIMFFAFAILFRIKHKKISAAKSALFAAGILAGFAAWFDYFHAALIGILFIYLTPFFNLRKNKGGRLRVYSGLGLKENWSRKNMVSMASFALGALIPLILLGLYQYAAFGNPFTTSYTYRFIPETSETYSLTVSGLQNIALPTPEVLFHMASFFLYSPILVIALYGLLKAILSKDDYFRESLVSLMVFLAAFLFSTLLMLSYYKDPAIFMQYSFKRYMKPVLPFIMIFIPYAFADRKLSRKDPMVMLFIIFGIISVFLNWVSAQQGGNGYLGHFNLETKTFPHVETFLKTGPSSSFLNVFSSIFGLNSLIVNLAGLALLALIIFLIWKNTMSKTTPC